MYSRWREGVGAAWLTTLGGFTCLPTCMKKGGYYGVTKVLYGLPKPHKDSPQARTPVIVCVCIFHSLFFASACAGEFAALICAVKVKGASGNTGRQPPKRPKPECSLEDMTCSVHVVFFFLSFTHTLFSRSALVLPATSSFLSPSLFLFQ